MTGDWAGKAIKLYGRNKESGTYAFFKEHILKDGDYKPGLREQKDSEEVIQEIIENPEAIGYSGIGFKKAGVNAISIGQTPDTMAAPSYLNCLTGAYPIARFLYIYVNKRPSEPVSLLIAEFLRFVFSRTGQTDVVKAGFFPLPAQLVQETREDTE